MVVNITDRSIEKLPQSNEITMESQDTPRMKKKTPFMLPHLRQLNKDSGSLQNLSVGVLSPSASNTIGHPQLQKLVREEKDFNKLKSMLRFKGDMYKLKKEIN